MEFIIDLIGEIQACKDQCKSSKDPCGIIYVHSRSDADKLSRELNEKHGMKTQPYHAGLDDYEKKIAHENWRNDHTQIIVATVAFGMGIDKPDVRFVIHTTLSKSMETYLQESGRAGRDGKLARCTLFYRREDISKVSSLIHDSNNKDVAKRKLYTFVKYFCEYSGQTCRRKSIGRVLNEEDPESLLCNRVCDLCCMPDDKPTIFDATLAAVQVMKIIRLVKHYHVRENISMIQLLEVWCGNGKIHKELVNLADMAEINTLQCPRKEVGGSKNNLMKIIVTMLMENLLQEVFIANAYSWNVYIDITQKGAAYLEYHSVRGPRNTVSNANSKLYQLKIMLDLYPSKSSRGRKRNAESIAPKKKCKRKPQDMSSIIDLVGDD